MTKLADSPLLSPCGASRLNGADTFGRADDLLRDQRGRALEGNPAQLIREAIALEREITAGLEKLPKEIGE